jgi:hypothetical protein
MAEAMRHDRSIGWGSVAAASESKQFRGHGRAGRASRRNDGKARLARIVRDLADRIERQELPVAATDAPTGRKNGPEPARRIRARMMASRAPRAERAGAAAIERTVLGNPVATIPGRNSRARGGGA